MTVLLMLLFIIIALSADAIVAHRKHQIAIGASVPVSVKINNVVQDIFVHDNGLCPTMADGGQKIEEKK